VFDLLRYSKLLAEGRVRHAYARLPAFSILPCPKFVPRAVLADDEPALWI
jgi:hypothetical protein